MRTLSIDLNDASTRQKCVQTEANLHWLGDLSPELTTNKSKRFFTQAIIGIGVLISLLVLSI